MKRFYINWLIDELVKKTKFSRKKVLNVLRNKKFQKEVGFDLSKESLEL